MRFERLTLSAFGHFTERTLEFGAQEDYVSAPDFHLLFGPNEAGKSTTLAAITDLLFGIEKSSRYRFLHENDPRLAATITGNGTSLNFRRRKGEKYALLDEAGSPMDEAKLTALRGPGDASARAFFTGMFGLDHVRLRQGGEEIHSAKGDLGQSLFQAGAAIRDLHAVLGKLEADSAQLFSPQGRNPRINAGISQYKDARSEMTKGALKGDAWTQARDEMTRLEGVLAELRDQMKDLRGQRSKLERIRRVLPLLARHQELACEGTDLATVPLLSADAARQRREAQEAQSRFRHALRDAEGQMERLGERLAHLSVDPRLLLLHDSVGRLQKRHGEIAKDLLDIPARRGERAQLAAQITAALRELGRDVNDLRSILPARPLVAHIRALMTEEAELAAEIRQTRKSAEDNESRIARLEAELAQVPPGAPSQPLKDALKDVARHSDDALREAEAELAHHRHAITAALAELPLWRGDASALARLNVPGTAALRATDDARRMAAQRVQDAEAALKAARDHHQRCEAELAGLSVAGSLATEAAVSMARRQRDDGWRLIRRRFTEGTPVDNADAYEQAVAEADSLADRVKGEAQRVTRLEEATKQMRLADHRLTHAETEAAEAAKALATADQAWAGLWQDSGMAAAPAPVMLAFLDSRAKVLVKLEQQAAAEQNVTRLRQGITDGSARLRTALGEDCAGLDFAALLARAESLCQRLDQIDTQRRSLESRLAADRTDAKTAGQRHRAALDALTQWRQRWGTALQPLNLPPEAGTAQVEEVLTILDSLADLVRRTDDLDHRIHSMETDVAAFDAEVTTLMGGDLKGQAPLDALSALAARVDAARNDDRIARDLRQQLTEAQESHRMAKDGLAEADSVLARLCQQAGCATPEELEEAERRSARRQQAEHDKAVQERLLLDSGDGLGLTELAAEAAAMDRDQIAAAMQSLDDQLAQLEEDGGALRDQLAQHKAAQEAMNGDSAAAQAAQEAERLAADIREDASQYIRLRLGHALLRQAVENYRQRHQGPLMARAAELFRRLTLGAFAGLDTGFDKSDQPILLAVRDDGKTVEIQGLSEGTRDQLFLALRLAAVEQHLDSGRRLPFIADDLLIHFDDDRAASALSILAELATKTQVLFFTHNRHMVDLAQRTLAADAVRMMTL
ncbi:MAG: AAA family ATPase [Rhodospirillaceae bacterium]|nr:AAA family ATPase [Rhodospirillales bacterium]